MFKLAFAFSRASEMQAKFIEEETQRRIEDIVMKRVEEELAKRKIDVDEEVMRKVEEAKKHVEHHLEGEYERRTKEIEQQFKAKEVILEECFVDGTERHKIHYDN